MHPLLVLSRDERFPTGASPKEATVTVFMDDGQRFLQRFVDGAGFVEVPLQVRPLPIQLPMIASSNVLDAGKGMLPSSGLVLPAWSNLLKVDGMTHDGIAVIELITYMFKRDPSREEPFKRSMVGRTLVFREGHAGDGRPAYRKMATA